MEEPPEDAVASGPAAPPDVVVDARGHRCPVPTLRLRRALDAIQPGQRVLLIADDPLARIDVPYFVQDAGVDLVASSSDDGALQFLVEKR